MNPSMIPSTILRHYCPIVLRVNIASGGRDEKLVFHYFLALRTCSFSFGLSKNLCSPTSVDKVADLPVNVMRIPFCGI